MDTYGQHWYHRTAKVRDMEAYETYEPIPEYIVSDKYEDGRVPGMMIYPYVRVDHARKLFEVHDNFTDGEMEMSSGCPSWSLTKKILKIFKIC